MKHRYCGTVNIAVKRLNRFPAARALVVSLVLAFPAAEALATNNPIPGIDIIVQRKPDGIAISVPVDATGRFSLQLQDAGDYSVSTSCRQECPPHKIIGTLLKTGGTDASPPTIGILIAPLFPAQAGPGPADSFDFTLKKPGPVQVRGEMPSVAAMQDVSTTRGMAPPAGDTPPGPPGAAINTSRSNIKRPGMVDAPAGDTPPGPPGASINTTRSNIKRPGLVDAPAGDTPPGPPSAAISTTRSNIKRPGLVDAPADDTPPGPPSAAGVGYWLVASDGGIQIRIRPEPDGSFQLTGLPPGNFVVTVNPVNDPPTHVGGGQGSGKPNVQDFAFGAAGGPQAASSAAGLGSVPVRVGADGSISGTLQADGRLVFGTAGIAINITGLTERWANLRASDVAPGYPITGITVRPVNDPPELAKEKEKEKEKQKPFAGGFGAGNALSGGFAGSGPGTMFPPAGPMSPGGPGGPMGRGPTGPGGPMGPGPGRP